MPKKKQPARLLPRGKSRSLAKASKQSMECEEAAGQRHAKIFMNFSAFPRVSLTRLLLTRCLDRLSRTTILEGDLWPHLTIWPRNNGRFGNVVLGETNTLQQASTEVEVAEPWRPWSTSNSNFSKLGRIRTLSKKTQDVDIWAMLPDDITRVRFLHFALWFKARLHHGNCSKCSIQILVSGHKCGSFDAPAWSRLGWYFGVGSANPWTHVTQRRFRGHTNFRSG